MLKLSTTEKTDIYKQMLEFSPYEVGVKCGYDKVYPNKNSLRTFMYNIKKEVEHDPTAFNIDLVLVDDVKKKSLDRAIVNRQIGIVKQDEVKLTDLMGVISKKAGLHIEKMLDHKTLPRNITISQLAMVMGIAVDKTLLLSGRATENIAFKAKIDVNMSSDQLLEALVGMRK